MLSEAVVRYNPRGTGGYHPSRRDKSRQNNLYFAMQYLRPVLFGARRNHFYRTVRAHSVFLFVAHNVLILLFFSFYLFFCPSREQTPRKHWNHPFTAVTRVIVLSVRLRNLCFIFQWRAPYRCSLKFFKENRFRRNLSLYEI